MNLHFDIGKVSSRKCKINSVVVEVLTLLNKISKFTALRALYLVFRVP